MKVSIISATGLLVVAGAAAVGASTSIDVNGNNRVISGSDTLKPVIQQILTNTPTAHPGTGPAPTESTNGTYFVGGGQSVGDSAIGANTQQLSPGTASLRNTAYVGVSIDTDGDGVKELPIQGTTEALLLGLDGLSILGNSTATGAPAAPAGLGLGLAVAGKTFVVNSHNADGSENTAVPPSFPGSATGANANYGAFLDTDGLWKYTLQSSIDVIRLIYGGLHHNGTNGLGDVNANSDVRRSLVNNWGAIFNTTANVAAGTQLNHAYRRSDLAGTTNAFIALVGFGNAPAGPGGVPASAARGIGTLTGTSAGNARKTSPFANDAALAGLLTSNNTGVVNLKSPPSSAVQPNAQVTTDPTANSSLSVYLGLARNDVNSFIQNNAGTGDSLDLDPIRRPAQIRGLNSIDLVASNNTASVTAVAGQGTLGLVIPIFYPDTSNIAIAQTYPTILADPGAFKYVTTGASGADTAPVGPTSLGKSLQPYWLANGQGYPGGNVTTHFQRLAVSTDPGFDPAHPHYITVTVTNAKGPRDPDVDIAVLNDGDPVNIQLAVSPDSFYTHHYNALSRFNNLPAAKFANDDGRSFNIPVRDDLTGAYLLDANGRELVSGFYKVRSVGLPSPASNVAFLPAAPNLTQTISDFQIGALVANDPQSIGFTGRGVDTNPAAAGFNTNIQALWLSGSSASGFNSSLSTPPADQNVLNLLVNPDGSLHAAPLNTAQGAAVYPLARRTYLATLVGFTENPVWSLARGGSGTFNPAAAASDGQPAVRGLQGDEYELAKAFGDSDHVGAAFLANGFIPLPPRSQYVGSASPPPVDGVYALDYPELNSTHPNASFLATGAGATPGGTNRDATIASPPVLKPYGTSTAAAGAPPTAPYPFHTPWPDPAFPTY